MGMPREIWQKVRALREEDKNSCEWSGLLPEEGKVNSIDQDLLRELVKYGTLSQAAYEAFDGGRARYKLEEFDEDLLKVHEKEGNGVGEYKVREYLYNSNRAPKSWLRRTLSSALRMRHVGGSGHCCGIPRHRHATRMAHEREVIQGARTNAWGTDALLGFKEGVEVHNGVWQMYTERPEKKHDADHGKPPEERNAKSRIILAPREVVRGKLRQLVQEYKYRDLINMVIREMADKAPGEDGIRVLLLKASITFTGHSLGGALALLAACDVGVMRQQREDVYGARYAGREKELEEGWDDISIVAHTFCTPKVGNDRFSHLLCDPTKPVLNLVNRWDYVPALPISGSGWHHTTICTWLWMSMFATRLFNIPRTPMWHYVRSNRAVERGVGRVQPQQTHPPRGWSEFLFSWDPLGPLFSALGCHSYDYVENPGVRYRIELPEEPGLWYCPGRRLAWHHSLKNILQLLKKAQEPAAPGANGGGDVIMS